MKECCACKRWFDQVDRCHIATRGSTGNGWEEEYWIPMCRYCHQVQSHLNWKRFTDKYPHLIPILAGKGWEIVFELGRWKTRRIMNG